MPGHGGMRRLRVRPARADVLLQGGTDAARRVCACALQCVASLQSPQPQPAGKELVAEQLAFSACLQVSTGWSRVPSADLLSGQVYEAGASWPRNTTSGGIPLPPNNAAGSAAWLAGTWRKLAMLALFVAMTVLA